MLAYRPMIEPQLYGAPARMSPGVHELYYLRRAWRLRFDNNSAPTMRVIEDLQGAELELALLLEELSSAVSQSVAAAVGPGFRPGAGQCLQLVLADRPATGAYREWHADQPEIGDYILTLTLEGDCLIELEAYEEGSARQQRARCRRMLQTAGSYYLIHGPSLAPLMHRVLGGASAARFSLTCRYVVGSPPPVPRGVARDEDRMERITSRAAVLAEQERQRQASAS